MSCEIGGSAGSVKIHGSSQRVSFYDPLLFIEQFVRHASQIIDSSFRELRSFGGRETRQPINWEIRLRTGPIAVAAKSALKRDSAMVTDVDGGFGGLSCHALSFS